MRYKATTISALIKWDHSSSWLVPTNNLKKSFGECVAVDVNDSEWNYVKGHEIDGRVLMPAISYLVRPISF